MRRVVIVSADEDLRRDLASSVRRAGYSVRGCGDVATSRARVADDLVEAVVVDGALAEEAEAIESLLEAAGNPTPRVVVIGGPASGRRRMQLAALATVRLLPAAVGIEELERALGDPDEAGTAEPWLGRDPSTQRLAAAADASGATDATVLIVGESGTGTSRLARRVQRASARRDAPFIEVDCSALSGRSGLETLERAWAEVVDPAAGGAGTLLFDHLGELDLRLQDAVSRRIEAFEAAATRAPAERSRSLPRLLATTRRPLREGLDAGVLRPELAYRFEVIVLSIPPLRARPADVADLAPALLAAACRRLGVEVPRIGPEVIALLEQQPFPGNVTELGNWMERAALLCTGGEIDAGALLGRRAAPTRSFVANTLNLRELEEAAIRRSLTESRGNRVRASEALGISVRTLRNKIRRYDLADVGRTILPPDVSI